MGNAPALWNHADPAHRNTIARLLAPLVTASVNGRKVMADTRDTPLAATLAAWVMSLEDLPREVIEAGVHRLVRAGVTFMPSPSELRTACAAVVDERRRQAAARARQQCEACLDSPGWVEVETPDGPAVRACSCREQLHAALTSAGAPIALPPARELTDGGDL